MKKDKEKINFKYNLKIYLGFLKKYKLIFLGILITISLSEIKYLIDKILFKNVIDKGAEFLSGAITLDLLMNILSKIGAIFIAFTILGFIFRWFNMHFINHLDSRLMADLKRKFFNHIIELDHNFHVTHKSGSLISRLIRGSGAMERMTDSIAFNMIPLIIQMIVITSSLIYLDKTSALIIFLTAISFISYNLFIQRIQESSKLAMNKSEDIEKANISDIFTNVDSVKYFGKEAFIKKRFMKLSENTRIATIKNWNFFRWFDSIQGLILGVGTFFLVYFPIIKFLNGEISLGTITFIYTIFIGFAGNLFGFVHGMRNFYRSMADFQDLFEYNKFEKEIKDKPDARDLKITNGNIEFRDITFKYGNRILFDKFNLKAPKHKKIALVGHSGSGKTTLVKLLYRFYDVNKGEILIDGKDIRNFRQQSLREAMAIVPQECILFDDTIYNNISFSNPKAKREDVVRAIKFAQLDKIIKSFPKKDKTIVGERGVKLSGGEKQRVSIARALLANKKILVLDEATSSLDSETEHEIQEALEKLMEGRTCIIIAHRLSTVMHADKIVVIKKGEIVQEGTHQELINIEGEYKKLWELQKGGYIK